MKRYLLLYYPLDDYLFEDQEAILNTYIKNHCNIIEIALPVENPVLDGKTIADSYKRVLERKSLDDYFEDIRKVKQLHPEINIQLMVYSQVIEKLGIDNFVNKARQADVSYVLSPDGDDNLNEKLKERLSPHNIDVIMFSDFKTDSKELERLKTSTGYIYQRSTDGISGQSGSFSDKLEKKIKAIKDAGIQTPICVGFGISKPEQFEQIFNMNADGCIMGSSLFKYLNDGLDDYLKQFNKWYENYE